MRVRTNPSVFLAAMLVMSCAMLAPRSAAGAPVQHRQIFASSMNRGPLMIDRGWGMLAWAQGAPRLPAGSRAAPTSQNDDDEMRLLEIPVRSKSPFIRGGANSAQIKRTTAQLSTLIKRVQPEIGDLSKGELPKNLIPDLKTIEKLSRRLRHQISR